MDELAQFVLGHTLQMDALQFIKSSQSSVVLLLIAKFLDLVGKPEHFKTIL